jgi:hypothetical protein
MMFSPSVRVGSKPIFSCKTRGLTPKSIHHSTRAGTATDSETDNELVKCTARLIETNMIGADSASFSASKYLWREIRISGITNRK